MIGKERGKVQCQVGDIIVSLDIISYREDGCRIIYCPALELSGYGRTKAAARESFLITLQEFMDYTLKKGTLPEVMRELGWEEESLEMSPRCPLSKDNICN